LLGTDNDGRTVFHMAADFCEPVILQGILNLTQTN